MSNNPPNTGNNGQAGQVQAGSSNNGGAKPAQPQQQAAAPLVKKMRVLDTTALEGPRRHEQIVLGTIKGFTFQPGQGLPLDEPIALKFLKHEGFLLVNDANEPIEFTRRPKQPDELGAGEAFKLGENDTVARYDELTNIALVRRVSEMAGGEKFAAMPKPDRAGMIEFIKAAVEAKRKANTVVERDASGFTPEAEPDDEAEAA